MINLGEPMPWRILKSEISKRHLKIRDIANGVGMPYRTLKKAINGQRHLYLSEAKRIHEKYFPDMTFEELFKW